MTHSPRVILPLLLSCCVGSFAFGQGGGFGAPTPKSPRPVMIAEPSSYTAQMARESLDVAIELGEIQCELGELADLLTERLEEATFFVDERAIKMAGLSADTVFEATLAEMPLRSALRRLLHRHGLRVVVEEEGLIITPDFAEVTRRGLATDRWVEKQSPANEKIWSALGNDVSLSFVDTPLDEAIAAISKTADVSIVIDARALEEIGLTTDTPVTMSLNNVTLRSYLRLMLRDLHLTFVIKDEVMRITTIEAAEQNLVSRIYFLEGTGIPRGDYQSAIVLIQTSVIPDTWEALGGPSTMAPIPSGKLSRPAVVISTTSDIHAQIESLLESMRDSHVGPDPQVDSPQSSSGKASPMPGGGMF